MFEGVIYHCGLIDDTKPCKPRLEVEAVLRPGDADQGPLLLCLAEYTTMAGGVDAVRRCIADFRDEGRIVDHLGVDHLAFAFWTPVTIDVPSQPTDSIAECDGT